MYQQTQLREVAAQRDLKRCGFTPESISAIQGTKVVTINGVQQVRPASDFSYLGGNTQPRPVSNTTFQNSSTQTTSASSSVSNTTDNSQIILSLKESLAQQEMLFARFKQQSDRRIMQLEMAVSGMVEQIKKMSEVTMTIKSNQNAAQARAALNPADRDPCATAIDRNGVAPKDVQIENIFYCGNRR